MKLEDVIVLARAGYTAEQIQKMAALPAEPAAPVPEKKAPVLKEQGPKAFTEIPNVEPNRPTVIPNFDDFYKGLAAALRKDNIIESKQKEPETADQILAKIINPPTKKEG